MFSERTTLQRLLLLKALSGGGQSLVERTALGNPLTFGTDVSKPLKSLLIPFTPKQSGTGDPSPQNIRPLVPWNGLKVKQGGKNLVSLTIGETKSANGIDYVVLSDGGVNCEGIANGSSYGIESKKTTLPSGKYTFSVTGATNAHTVIVKNNAYYREINGVGSTTFTLTEETVIRFYIMFSSGAVADETVYVQLEAGQTATAYEPYEPITETDIVFPSAVYGGSAEIVSGAMTQTILFVSAKWKDFEGNTAYTDTVRRDLVIPYNCLYGSAGNGKTLCNMAKYKYNNDDDPHFYLTDAKRIRCFMPKDMDGETEITFTCALAEPIPLESIEPHHLTALVGNNTIWSDADGSMTAVYLVSSKYAEDHPVGGLGSGLGSGLLGSGTEDNPEDPADDPIEDPEEEIPDNTEEGSESDD